MTLIQAIILVRVFGKSSRWPKSYNRLTKSYFFRCYFSIIPLCESLIEPIILKNWMNYTHGDGDGMPLTIPILFLHLLSIPSTWTKIPSKLHYMLLMMTLQYSYLWTWKNSPRPNTYSPHQLLKWEVSWTLFRDCWTHIWKRTTHSGLD